MRRSVVRRRVLSGIAVVGAVICLSTASAGSAAADPVYPGGPQWSEVGWCANPFNTQACAAGKDAQPWALGVAVAIYGADPEIQHNGLGDAFRHCIWSGAIAQRVGHDKAYELVSNHEVNPDQPPSEAAMDAGNNMIGTAIGAQANQSGGRDTWGWIISQCRSRADNGALYRMGGINLMEGRA